MKLEEERVNHFYQSISQNNQRISEENPLSSTTIACYCQGIYSRKPFLPLSKSDGSLGFIEMTWYFHIACAHPPVCFKPN